MPFGDALALLVLRFALLRLSHPGMHVLRRHGQHFRQHGQHPLGAAPAHSLGSRFWAAHIPGHGRDGLRGRTNRWRTHIPACRHRRRGSTQPVPAAPRRRVASGSCGAGWRTSGRQAVPTNLRARRRPAFARSLRSGRIAAAALDGAVIDAVRTLGGKRRDSAPTADCR